MKQQEIDRLTQKISWCNEYITDFIISGNFSPYAALTGEADKKQRLYIESVNFLQTIEKELDNFEKIQKKNL